MALAAQRIGYYVSLPWVVMQSHIIILYKLQPSSLPKVQFLLGENVLQTLMIRVHITMVSNKVMSPSLQRMHLLGNVVISKKFLRTRKIM